MMRQLNYVLKASLLKGTIEDFLRRRSIGSYKDEAHFRSKLAECLESKGFDVEEEREIEMMNGDCLIPDIIVHVYDKCILLELKYNNPSLKEYVEDEDKCKRYIKDFGDVPDAYCLFVSNIVHDYRPEEWIECGENSKYHYLWISFHKKHRSLRLN